MEFEHGGSPQNSDDVKGTQNYGDNERIKVMPQASHSRCDLSTGISRVHTARRLHRSHRNHKRGGG